MSEQRKHLIHLRGTEEWERAIHRTLRAARKAGVQVDTVNGLAAVALAEMALRLGIMLPPRARPNGRQPAAKKSKKVTENVVD